MNIKSKIMKPAIVILALAGIAVGFAYTQAKGAADALDFTGSVEATQVDVSPEIHGNVLMLQVKDGEKVMKGQPLFTLDTTDYDLKLEMARSLLKIAQLNASDIEEGSRSSQVDQAKANMNSVQEQLNGALSELSFLKKEYERLKVLYDTGAAPEQQLDSAKRAVEKAQASYQTLQRQKEAAAAALSLVQEGAKSQTRSAAQEQVRLKELEMAELERTITKGVIVSPLEGLVQSVNFEEGERVSPGQKAVTLIDMSRLELKIYVPEKQLHRIAVGTKAVFGDAFLKNQEISGTVDYISAKAEFTPKNIESKENKQEMVYEVRVEIRDNSGLIKPGMFLDVTLEENHQ